MKMLKAINKCNNVTSGCVTWCPQRENCCKPSETTESTSVASYLDHLASTLLTFPSCQAIFHQHQPMVSMHLSSFAMPVVAQIILIF